MFTIRSEHRILTIFRGAVLTIAAIVFLVMGGINCYRMTTPAIDLNDPDLDWDTLKAGQHVEMDVDFIMGEYMYTTEDGSERSRDYMLGHLDVNESTGRYYIDGMLGFKVTSGYFDKADIISDNCYRWWSDTTGEARRNTETIHVEGILSNMNKDQKKYSAEFMTKAGFSNSDQDKYFHPLYIANNANMGKAFLAVGVIFIIAGPLVLLYGIKKR